MSAGSELENSSELTEQQAPRLVDDLPAKPLKTTIESFSAIIPSVRHTQQSSISEPMSLAEDAEDVVEEPTSAPVEPTIVQANFVRKQPSQLESAPEYPFEDSQSATPEDRKIADIVIANESPFDATEELEMKVTEIELPARQVPTEKLASVIPTVSPTLRSQKIPKVVSEHHPKTPQYAPCPFTSPSRQLFAVEFRQDPFADL